MGTVLFTDDSRFSLSNDSHRILIWREQGSRNHPSNIIERDRYGGHGVLKASCLVVVQTFTSSTQAGLAARTLPPVTILELRLALQDEWAATTIH
ncbi:hypothetical protein TNCV_1876001 [Trichonephila clavipes]|nr:hypothetical protein TNCV_1876001 [Trichonephila clavipes]